MAQLTQWLGEVSLAAAQAPHRFHVDSLPYRWIEPLSLRMRDRFATLLSSARLIIATGGGPS